MPQSEISALQHSDLNPFLYADVGTEPNGMMLQVMSALARLGLDPWTEAERLAHLPIEEAVRGLSRVVSGALPGGHPDVTTDAGLIARRLIALLPDRKSAGGAPLPPRSGVTFGRAALWITLGSAVLLVVNLVVSGLSNRADGPATAPQSLSQPILPPSVTADPPAVMIR